MKYSFYVKNYLKKEILKEHPEISESEAEKKAKEEFEDILINAFYESALASLSDADHLKKLEQEPVLRFLDIRYKVDEYENINNPYCFLYHGIRFDSDHKILEKILSERAIKCGNLTKYHVEDDNCNEGKYISLMPYSGEKNDLEFKLFIEENVSFILSPKLNPIKCQYLPYDEWKNVKKKLPATKQRYSYAKEEYQYPLIIPFKYVVGILYPLRYYEHINGYTKTKEDFEQVRSILRFYGKSDLPILDPTDHFRKLNDEPSLNDKFIISREMFL